MGFRGPQALVDIIKGRPFGVGFDRSHQPFCPSHDNWLEGGVSQNFWTKEVLASGTGSQRLGIGNKANAARARSPGGSTIT